MTTILVRRQERRQTTAAWTSANPIPLDGELCIELRISGQRLIKIGDGVTHFLDLPYLTADPTNAAHAADVLVTPVGDIGSTNVQAALVELDGDIGGKVDKTLYDAQSVLVAIADNNPVAVALGASQLLGRKATGNIGPVTVNEILALLAVYTSAQTDTAISTQINALVGGAPGLLDTLKELADALGDDPNFAATMTAALAAKADDNAVVKLLGNQTVDGIKKWVHRPVTSEFSGSPVPGFAGGVPVDGSDATAALVALNTTPGDLAMFIVRPGEILHLSDNVTLTKIDLKVIDGGLVQVANGKALTPRPGGFIAGLYQCIDTSLGGRVNPTSQTLKSAWWGDKADGTDVSVPAQWMGDAAGRAGKVTFEGAGIHAMNNVGWGSRQAPLIADTVIGSPVTHVDPALLVPPGQTLQAGDIVTLAVLDYDNAKSRTVQNVDLAAKTVTFTTNNSTVIAAGTVCGGPGQILDVDVPDDAELRPYANGPMLHIQGVGAPKSDSFTMRGEGLYLSTTFDHDYTYGVISAQLVRNIHFPDGFRAAMSGTGAALQLDTSYATGLEKPYCRLGKYALGALVTATVKNQIDTIDFGPGAQFFGNCGVIVRSDLATEIHNIKVKNTKVIADSSNVDMKVEAALAVASAVGDTTVTLQTGQGALVAALAGLFGTVQQPIFIGFGGTIEMNKILSVAGDVVTLAKPLQYTHTGDAADSSIATEVLVGALGVSTPTASNVELQGCHWESLAVGWSNGGGRRSRFHDSYSGADECVRNYGKVQDFLLDWTTMAANAARGATITDGVAVAGGTGKTFTSASYTFTNADIGKIASQALAPNIAAGNTIASINSAHSVELSIAHVLAAGGLTVDIGQQVAVRMHPFGADASAGNIRTGHGVSRPSSAAPLYVEAARMNCLIRGIGSQKAWFSVTQPTGAGGAPVENYYTPFSLVHSPRLKVWNGSALVPAYQENNDGEQIYAGDALANIKDLGTGNIGTDGDWTGRSLKATGLTGAVLPGRFVGVTASGAPVSGTFAVADYVITQDGNMLVCTAAGTPGTWVQPGAATYAKQSIVDAFSSSGTWTKRAGLTGIRVAWLSGGGGGGSGRRGAAGTLRNGGGSGAGGSWGDQFIPAALLASTVTVTVGAGGTAGAAVTADDTDGNPGIIGGTTQFGSPLTYGASAFGGAPGAGGTAAAGTAASSGGGMISGGAGVICVTGVAAVGTNAGAAGVTGGSGGGITVGNAVGAGGAGGRLTGVQSSGAVAAGGTVPGGNGGDGPFALPATEARPGSGAGGGAASITGAAGAGGAPLGYAAGGAGGGASLNGNNSGAGGAGGPGVCIVINYF